MHQGDRGTGNASTSGRANGASWTSWNDTDTDSCVLIVTNDSADVEVEAFWLDFAGTEVKYLDVPPGHAVPQRTFTTHYWRIRRKDNGKEVGRPYAGPSATLEVSPDCSTLAVRPLEPGGLNPRPEWGEYSARGEALGVQVMAYQCVGQDAVVAACRLVRRMLEGAPRDVVQRLEQAGTKVAIIGRDQVTSDIPEHWFMKYSRGGRDIDATTRGLGGTVDVPVTSCGEENLTMVDDRRYPHENILIHEFGHSIMNIGLTEADQQRIHRLYEQARDKGLYDRACYMMENADEYWAEGCQSWFDATIREDVNSGINTREKLKRHDPGLAEMLQEVFGDGTWRFPQDAPAPLSTRSSSAKPAPSSATTAAAAAGAAAAGAAVQPPDVEVEMDRSRLAAQLQSPGRAWMANCLPVRPGGGGASSTAGLLCQAPTQLMALSCFPSSPGPSGRPRGRAWEGGWLPASLSSAAGAILGKECADSVVLGLGSAVAGPAAGARLGASKAV